MLILEWDLGVCIPSTGPRAAGAAVLGPHLGPPRFRPLLPTVIHTPRAGSLTHWRFWLPERSFKIFASKCCILLNLEQAIKLSFLFTLSWRLSWWHYCVYYNAVISVDVYSELIIPHWLFLPFVQSEKTFLLSGPSVTCHLSFRRLRDTSPHVPYLIHCHPSCFSMWSFMLRVTLKGLERADGSRNPGMGDH